MASSTNTHDYGPGHLGWGHDYTFDPIDGGQRAKMSGWGSGIREGDYLLIESNRSPDGRTRYQVQNIRYCIDPPDMWFAQVAFAPRIDAASSPRAAGEGAASEGEG